MTKVLTIDNEEVAVERIVKILESNDYRVQSATTWTEAVDAITHGQPNLVLLNLEMPIVRGDVLVEFIREEGFEMPVIAVSFPIEDAVAQALQGKGVYSIVEKPFGEKVLVEEIERVLALFQVEEDIESDAEDSEEKVSEESSEATDEQEASPESTAEEEESEPFLKQSRDLRASSRTKMSKRKKIIMFTVIGAYVLIVGFGVVLYFTDEVPAFVDQILSNW